MSAHDPGNWVNQFGRKRSTSSEIRTGVAERLKHGTAAGGIMLHVEMVSIR